MEKTTLVILLEADTDCLARLLDAISEASYDELILVGDVTRYDVNLLSRATQVISKNTSIASGLNQAVEAAHGTLIGMISDRLLLPQAALRDAWRILHNNDIFLLGSQIRDSRGQNSPFLHFLSTTQIEFPAHQIQNPQNVSGDFFSARLCAFRRNSFIQLDGFDESFNSHLIGVDLGRRIYANGQTIHFLRQYKARFQDKPSLKHFVSIWQSEAEDALKIWKKYPDRLVQQHALRTLHRWSKDQDRNITLDQLINLDTQLRDAPMLDTTTLFKASRLYEMINRRILLETISAHSSATDALHPHLSRAQAS